MKEDMRKLMNLFESRFSDKVDESSCVKEESDCLTEALGNLEAVSPNLLKAAKRRSMKFRKLIGEHGVIKERVITGRDLAQALRDIDESSSAAVVIGRYGSGNFEQMFIIVPSDGEGWVMLSDLRDVPKDIEQFAYGTNYPRSLKALYGWMNSLRKLESFQDGNELSIMVVSADFVRKDIQGTRAMAKSDRVLTPSDPGYKKFIQNLKGSLRSRLDDFKKAKAAGVDTPEEFLKYVKENGFVDKIKIGELIYERGSMSGSFDSLLVGQRQDDPWYQVRISYTVDYEDFWELEQKLLKSSGGDTLADEQRDTILATLPPRSFEIRLGQISPGTFGPVGVRIS